MWEGLTKKMRQKKQKKQKFFSLSRVPGQGTQGRQALPRVSEKDTRERASSPSAFPGTRGRIFVFLSFNGVGGVNRQVACFFAECRSSPSVRFLALGEASDTRGILSLP